MIDSSLLFVTILTNLVLGFIVFFRKENDVKKVVNLFFFLIILFLTVWTVSNYLADWLTDISLILVFVRSTYAAVSVIAGLFFYFSLVFPEGKKYNRKRMLLISLLPALFTVVSYTHMIVKDVVFNANKAELITGPAYIPFTVYFIFYMGAAFYILIRKYKSFIGVERQQIKYFFIGTFLTALSAFLTNLLIPMFTKNWDTSHYGPYFSILLVIFTTYAIFKHHLFDIKVVLTELLVGLVAIVLLIDFITAESLVNRLIKIDILIAFCYLGVSLIKSVLREIKYREEIKKAYDVEKLAHQELERLDEVKDQFLMATQHHLRTPITSMIGYTDMLLDGFYGDVSPKTKETLLKLMKSSKNLNKVVNELLDLSQFQLGKSAMVLKPGVEIMPILKSIIAEVKLEAKEKKLYLRMEKPEEEIPEIKADASKLEVALTNLIDNAVKYTAKGGVKIKVERPDSKIRIIIKDTGMGMAKEDIEKLFSKTFERGEEAKKMFGSGKGIGLYLSYNIIKSHNGKLWAESDGPGKGSSFIVELPV